MYISHTLYGTSFVLWIWSTGADVEKRELVTRQRPDIDGGLRSTSCNRNYRSPVAGSWIPHHWWWILGLTTRNVISICCRMFAARVGLCCLLRRAVGGRRIRGLAWTISSVLQFALCCCQLTSQDARVTPLCLKCAFRDNVGVTKGEP